MKLGTTLPAKGLHALAPELPTWEERIFDVVAERGAITGNHHKLHKENGCARDRSISCVRTAHEQLSHAVALSRAVRPAPILRTPCAAHSAVT